MVNFVMMIGRRSLNFEDEIFLRGVECNIPPVSIGILPVNRVRGNNSWRVSQWKIFYKMSVFLREKYQSRFKHVQGKGKMVNSHGKDIYLILDQNISFFPYPFSL
jgi:hypothetical protein